VSDTVFRRWILTFVSHFTVMLFLEKQAKGLPPAASVKLHLLASPVNSKSKSDELDGSAQASIHKMDSLIKALHLVIPQLEPVGGTETPILSL
jgi:hypothetical protein